MKKFVFSLERMLNFQEQNLEKEKVVLGRITAERDALENRRLEMEEKIALIQEEIVRREHAGTTVFILKSCYSVLESARHQLAELQEALRIVREKLEKQRQVVTEASQEVKKLEKLKEKQVAEYHHGEAKEQQEVIAEHVAGDFVRRGVSK